MCVWVGVWVRIACTNDRTRQATPQETEEEQEAAAAPARRLYAPAGREKLYAPSAFVRECCHLAGMTAI